MSISKQERGREDVSFPVAEILKPRGFRERSDLDGLSFRLVFSEDLINTKVAKFIY